MARPRYRGQKSHCSYRNQEGQGQRKKTASWHVTTVNSKRFRRVVPISLFGREMPHRDPESSRNLCRCLQQRAGEHPLAAMHFLYAVAARCCFRTRHGFAGVEESKWFSSCILSLKSVRMRLLTRLPIQVGDALRHTVVPRQNLAHQ